MKHLHKWRAEKARRETFYGRMLITKLAESGNFVAARYLAEHPEPIIRESISVEKPKPIVDDGTDDDEPKANGDASKALEILRRLKD
jgi:hypothetical protein